MTASVEPVVTLSTRQKLLTATLRGTLNLLFRGLMGPQLPVKAQRALLRGLTAATLTPRGVHCEQTNLGGVPAEVWRPDRGGEGRVILYLHGGAYLIGSPATHRAITANLARRCKAEVWVLDYRLAPEHRFPAQREDAVAAYRALLDKGIPAAAIAVAGDSAGGHLTLQLALQAKAQNLPTPGALVTFSPVTDLTGEHLHAPAAGDPLITRAWIDSAMGMFCPPGVPRADAQLSPLYADLTGLPPLLIQVGEDEVLRNDSLRFVAAARRYGATVELQRFPGCWHVFQAHAGLLDVADRALQDVAHFVASHLQVAPMQGVQR
ncbi:alpha/beta hydrolase [Pseudomonas nicosulfuronedens]|uniref:Alpha/beta hydrolase n=1 Tax=Pseudomonas nicosulfuronedens TaxID=2571105 RepID=A0A5R9QWI7_9PSED|nr:alpha/beta hydrolase [Pseudomonas nicosulfuronedens]MDH1011216.1 alpha/beta hydrolase [Pseudomonas nicosulfuronedens]MDH1981319.1 alpha/beta hydrolase [Pseudomonas nicosulfuronedens]MDH2029215.1 alpha/beta hydrolase [Pseudomonas nicosulfuronedens]TLX73779.1 alpha/beta hydrolase [Pseudomonas nicosulfuronedens]